MIGARSTAARPSKTLANRILVSFGITLVAFAVTVGFTIAAQKRAADDSEELAKGFVPVALNLGKLRAVQSTLTAIIEGVPDEKNPHFTRDILKTLDGERRLMFEKTRLLMDEGLRALGSRQTRALAVELTRELDAAQAEWANDRVSRERLFAALDDGDSDAANRELIVLGAMEHGAVRRLDALAERVDAAIHHLSEAARSRERRAVLELALLAALTLAVGIGVSIHTRRLLEPLERVTQRASAVARGDLTARPIERTDDEIGELASTFERMVAAVAKAQSRALANERLAAIGKMAAHVTHEIRNPLSSISLNIELLEENLADAGVRGEPVALLAAITREVQRLEQLSEEYLRVARLPQPRMEDEELAVTVREIVDFARPEMQRAGLALDLELEDELPPALYDEGQIRQAVLNVLRNAREAMPDGGTIEVYVRADGMSLVVGVEDRGSGIVEEVRSRIFDPFFSTKGEGTGLGLAITRQIVEAHGGSIDVTPREGGGTSFRILLPIAHLRGGAASSAPSTHLVARPSERAI